MICCKQPTNQICYIILPEGVRDDLTEGLKRLSEKHVVSLAFINEVNWNDDLTPWPAKGVFKKVKPFGGQATSFLDKLTHEIIPEIEEHQGIAEAERTILGVSLSGLFAIWAGFNSDAFTNIISISGSLWYDGFTDWMSENTPSAQLNKICMLLGEKEKNSKEKRMTTVEEKTLAAVHILEAKSRAKVSFELVEGTHFSPLMPRLERAFDMVYGKFITLQPQQSETT